MSRYQPPSSTRRRAPENPSLPKGFSLIHELLNGGLTHGKSVSIVGVVKDYRLPMPTKGADYKCTLTLCDISTEDENEGINLNIFRKEEEMPKVDAGDIVIASMAKFQVFGGTPSLLSQSRTDIHVYEAQRLPSCRSSRSAWNALKKPSRKVSRSPDTMENEYVLWLFDRIDKSSIPDQQQFSARVEQSLNIKEKFSLLKDVKDHKFADLIVQVVKEPFDLGDKVCLWVSDYTENASFFNRIHDSADWTNGWPSRDGDPYGYTNKFSKKSAPLAEEEHSKWIGPYGKKSIQITCWEPHVNFIREHIGEGDWVRLRNVQIGYGHNATNIEGFLRQDRSCPNRVCVDILDPQADRETVDPRLIDAIQRKWDLEKDEKHCRKTGEKRRVEEPPKKENTKSKRQKLRERKQKQYEEIKAEQEAALGLNDLVRCENPDRALDPLTKVIEPVIYQTTVNDSPANLELPFTCAKFRTQVRVVDFHPGDVRDFAVSRPMSDFDILGNHEASDDDSDSSGCLSRAARHRKIIWEWRFALKLEEVSASPPKAKKPASVWVLVNNMDAQCLTDLNAADLHSGANADLLSEFNERMFQLWGNLAERKSLAEAKRRQHARNPLGAPPADSSDVEDHADRRSGVAGGGAADMGEGHVPGSSQLSNRPFTCCIRQYGVKVKAEDGEEENAGEGMRWQRIFGLFGTRIVSD